MFLLATDSRYIQKTGWIARDTEEISIYKIEEVDLSQSILGRILGYGYIFFKEYSYFINQCYFNGSTIKYKLFHGDPLISSSKASNQILSMGVFIA